VHQSIKKVTRDIEGDFKFNTAISAVMELVNATYQAIERGCVADIREAVKTAVILLAPFVPHAAEELWEKLGNKASIFKEPWPEYDEGKAKEDMLILPVLINGKVRSRLEIAADMSEEEIKERVMADAKVKTWLKDNPIRKLIVVPKKLVNIVI